MFIPLSKSTIQVLHNFCSINSNMLFREGRKQRVIESNKTVMAEIELEEDIPWTFKIYDLGELVTMEIGRAHV